MEKEDSSKNSITKGQEVAPEVNVDNENSWENENDNIEAEKKEFDDAVARAEDAIDLTNTIDKYSKTLARFYEKRFAANSINTAIYNFSYNLGNPLNILDDIVRDKVLKLYSEQRELSQKKNIKLQEAISTATKDNLIEIIDSIGGIQEGDKFYYAQDIREMVENYTKGVISDKDLPKNCGFRERVVRLFGRGIEKKISSNELSATGREEVTKFFDERVLTFPKYKQWRVDKILNGEYNKDTINFLKSEFHDEVVLDREFLAGNEKRIELVWKFLEKGISLKIDEFEKRLKDEEREETEKSFTEEEKKILLSMGEIIKEYIENAKIKFDFSIYPPDKVAELIEIQAEFYMIKEINKRKVFLGREKKAVEFIIKNKNN